MKVLVRGKRGTGKTSLLNRLQGQKIPKGYNPTPEIATATINWNFKNEVDEGIKVEVWDVVDKASVQPDKANGKFGMSVSEVYTESLFNFVLGAGDL